MPSLKIVGMGKLKWVKEKASIFCDWFGDLSLVCPAVEARAKHRKAGSCCPGPNILDQ